MRKIESILIQKIRERQNFKNGERDEVIYDENENKLVVKLWGHTIAIVQYDRHKIQLDDCGFVTHTTMSRLNAVTAALSIPVTFRIKNYCASVSRNGELTEEKEFTVNGWTVCIA